MSLKQKSTVVMIAVGWLACTPIWAASVSVMGLFKDKAIVSIDGGKPRTLSVGQVVQGVKLISADSGSASFDVDGEPRTCAWGNRLRVALQQANARAFRSPPMRAAIFPQLDRLMAIRSAFWLTPAPRPLPSMRLKPNASGWIIEAGQAVGVSTAGGVVPAWRVKFNTVKVGSITLNQVDGMVVETGLNVPLLGMSFPEPHGNAA